MADIKELFNFIEKHYPVDRFGGQMGVIGDHADKIRTISPAAKEIDLDQLAVTGADKMAFRHAIAGMDSALATWPHNSGYLFGNLDGSEHPINSVRRILGKHIKAMEGQPPKPQKKLKVFLSYSSIEKKLAGEIKAELERYRLDVFLAYHTINPLQKWRDEIEKELDLCDVFLPLLTVNFKKSDWTDQECGIAYARSKVILPINAGVQPYGFVNHIQACPLNPEQPGFVVTACQKIVQSLAKEQRLIDRFRNLLIDNLNESNSFHKTKFAVELLDELEPFTPEQLQLIVKAWHDNQYVHGYDKGILILNGLISRNNDKLIETTRSLLKGAREKTPPIVFPAH